MTGKLARIKIILGILLAATPALAQQLPFSLPANSVVGRTNVTGNSGDAYAIPFAQLASLLSTYGLVQAPSAGVQGHVVVFGSTPGMLVDGGGVYTDTTNASNISSGTLLAGRMPALTGDVTSSAGAVATTLATVNANVGSFGSATQCVTVTNNAKGLTTAISAATCTPAIGSITGFGTGVAAALALNVGSAGAPVTFNGAGGTPSSITLTSGTGLPISTGLSGAGTGVLTALGVNVGTAGSTVVNGGALGTPSSGVATNLTGTASGLTSGNVTTNANLTGDVTSVGNATTFTGKVGGALGQIPGANTNTNASAGNIGEYVVTQVLSGSAVALTSGAPANLASISLTAGDWDVTCQSNLLPAGTTNTSFVETSISTTSATRNTVAGFFQQLGNLGALASAYLPSAAIPNVRQSLSATTTIYCVVSSTFTVSTSSVFGQLSARRVR